MADNLKGSCKIHFANSFDLLAAKDEPPMAGDWEFVYVRPDPIDAGAPLVAEIATPSTSNASSQSSWRQQGNGASTPSEAGTQRSLSVLNRGRQWRSCPQQQPKAAETPADPSWKSKQPSGKRRHHKEAPAAVGTPLPLASRSSSLNGFDLYHEEPFRNPDFHMKWFRGWEFWQVAVLRKLHLRDRPTAPTKEVRTELDKRSGIPWKVMKLQDMIHDDLAGMTVEEGYAFLGWELPQQQ